MKKLIWAYLDMRYPNTYRKKTKFGLCATHPEDRFLFLRAADEVSHVFCYERNDAFDVLRDWINTKPIVDNIPNSTNPDVLIYV